MKNMANVKESTHHLSKKVCYSTKGVIPTEYSWVKIELQAAKKVCYYKV